MKNIRSLKLKKEHQGRISGPKVWFSEVTRLKEVVWREYEGDIRMQDRAADTLHFLPREQPKAWGIDSYLSSLDPHPLP